MKRLLLVVPLALASCAAPAPSTAPGTEGASSASASLARARQLIQAGNYDEALLATDAILAQEPNHHAARLLAADANLALAEAGKGNVQAFLLDAQHNLEAASESKPDDAETRVRLADVYLKNGYFEKGRDAALEAARLLRSRHADSAAIAGAVLAAADNEMQIFVDVRQAELARQERVSDRARTHAEAVLARLAVAKQGLPGKAARRVALVHQWLGQPDTALQELERGILADPSEPEVHVAYQDLMLGAGKRAECVAAYKRMIAEAGDSPTLQFYLGRAQFSAADGLRARGDWDQASEGYGAAKATFARYQALRPAHKETATHWQAMCDLSCARMALDRGALDEAKRLYFQAFATDPRVLPDGNSGSVTIVDSFGGTYAGGLFRLGTALAEGSSPESLSSALAFFEEVIAKHGDAMGQFYNNAGLAARDLGAAVAKNDPRAATDLWERSYRYYRKAVALVPDDPRIVNDCGLMLVYHLHRDLDQAKAMFERAIALGESQLAALPADATDEQRQFLEEAVGDAYQNLGVMARQQGKPFAEYRATLEQSVRFYPHQRRSAAQLLRTQGAHAEGLPTTVADGAATAPTSDQATQEALRTASAAAERAAAAGDYDAALAALDAHRSALGDLPQFQTLVQRLAERKRTAGEFKEATARVDAALAESDYDTALLALDAHAQSFAQYAPFHVLMGRCSLLYALDARSKGGSASQIDGLFADAASHLSRARDLDPEASDARFWLARALAESGKFGEAASEAADLLSHIRSLGHTEGLDLAEVHRVRAEAAARSYIESKQGGGDDQDLLRGARDSLRYLADNGTLDAGILKTWIGLEQWAGAPAQALEVALRAMQTDAPAGDVLDLGIQLAAQLGDSAKVVAALAGSEDPTKQWYLGRALFQQAQELWADDKAAAVRALDASRTAFTASKESNASFGDSCDQWIALGLGSKGIMLLGDGKAADAEAVLLEALRLRPDCAANDLGGGNSTKRAVLVLGGKYQDDLGKLEALMRAATEAVPTDIDFANNHGLAARDYGNALEREGATERASEMYEASYASYQRAAALDPHNVRLRNDCALLLIYHLHRDLDHAVSMLESARDEGLKQLQEAPPSTAQGRQDLDEAIGDCIENLGYYYETHAKDRDKAVAAYQESMKHYPQERRAATRRLRALEQGNGK
ncbi:MAG: tetratricopeptide repeat protein [Planctomycetota bacterium]